MKNTAEVIWIHGWRIQTPIDGEIQAFEGPDEDYYVIYVHEQKVAENGISPVNV